MKPAERAVASAQPPSERRLLPNAWTQDNGHVVLLAARCGRCETLTFPPAAACPECWERHDLRREALVQPGVVAAVSVVHVPAKGIPAPYAVAYIDFDGGVRLCGRLKSWDGLRVGDRVTAVPGVLRTGPDGDLHGWFFRKVGA